MHRFIHFAPLLAVLALALAAAPARAQNTAPAAATDSVNMARGLFNEGNALMREENFAEALGKFDEGLALDSTSLSNAYGRAQALAQLDREDDALNAYQHAVMMAEAEGNEQILAGARRWIGATAYRRANELLQANPLPRESAEQALPLLQQAEANGVDSNQLPYQFARAYNATGQYAEAARYAEQAVQANTGSGDLSGYYIELGLARKGAGDIAGAREALEQAKNGSWSGWAEHYLRELDAMETSEGG